MNCTVKDLLGKKKETSEYLTKINDSDISFLPY